MFNVIKKYIDNMSIDDFRSLALKNDIIFNNDELSFSYKLVKTNWFNILENIDDFDLSIYQDKFSKDNYDKLCKLFKVMYDKYSIYLK